MPRKTKSDAQKAHELRNKTLAREAKARKVAAKKAGKIAFRANIAKMKKLSADLKAARVDAHEQRNAEAAYAAAARRADQAMFAKVANDNGAIAAAA